MCKQVYGISISAYLSARLTEVPPECKVAATPVPLFTKEDDEFLLKEFQTHGRKWKLIAEKIGKHYTAVSVKYRILLLTASKRIRDGLESDIDDEDPMNQNDDETTSDELSAYRFDLKESLRKMYDPERDYRVKIRIVPPSERIKKKKAKKKISFAFEKHEDEEAFSLQRRNGESGNQGDTANESDYESEYSNEEEKND